MFSDHGTELVKTDFAGLLRKPLIPVIVLGRTNCKVESVRVAAPFLHRVKHDSFDAFVAVRCYSASIEGAASVYYIDLVSAFMPEDFDAVSGFVVVQTADPSLYVC
jgi:hypothetical protein